MQLFDREAAIDYAKEWALRENPRFFTGKQSSGAGFVSECVYSGAGVMNETKVKGWYYKNRNSKSKSWNVHSELFNFLINNKGIGPYGKEITENEAIEGDIVAFEDENGNIFQSAVITKTESGQIFVCAHHFNSYMRPISTYKYSFVRFFHIIGVRND